MKKFLSVLLALAVGFTFTFGSSISAFADTPSPYWEKVVGNGEIEAEKALEPYEVNYDVNYTKAGFTTNGYSGQTDAHGEAAPDPTVFKIPAAYLGTALQNGLYQTVLADESTYTTAIGTVGNNEKADIELIKAWFLNNYDDDDLDAAGKLAWDEYKEYLKTIVNGISLAGYTNDTGVTYTVGSDEYTTSAKAAAAMVEAMNNTIKTAAYVDIDSYADLYDDLVYLETKPAWDDAEEQNYVKTVQYVLVAADDSASPKILATTSDDAINKDKIEAAQLTEKSKLNQAIVNWKTSGNYNSKQDAAIAAYKEAMTYIIENTDNIVNAAPSQSPYTIETANSTTVNSKNYIAYCATAAEYIKTNDQNKAYMDEVGLMYDAQAMAKALKAVLLDVYATGTTAKSLYTSAIAVTPAAKSAIKEHIENIVPAAYDAEVMGNSTEAYDLLAYYYDGYGAYYEAEWTAVKAAVDAYNAAIDAANTVTDFIDAFNEFEKAMNRIDEASEVDADIALYYSDGSATDLESIIAGYYNTVLANSGESKIFISWDGESYNSTLNDDEVKAWLINKGARTKTEVKAAYADAKVVIDAYKTLSAVKADAAAVVEMIKALPEKAANVTAENRDAIVAAKTAYNNLPAEAQTYVASVVGILNDDLAALEKLEANALKATFDALPNDTVVGPADKDKIDAAQAALDAYNEQVANGVYSGTYLETYENKVNQEVLDNKYASIEAKEYTAIKDAYRALQAKYDTTGITAADAEAVKALQEAIDKFIADYPESYYLTDPELGGYDVSTIQFEASKMAAELDREDQIVNKYDNQDAKADLLDMSRKLTIWRTSKTSIRVTAIGSVKNIKANGYTVKYSFYKKAPGSKTYKLVKSNSTSSKYTYTNLKKGWNYFQVKVKVYDPEGKLVATKMTYYRAAKIK